MEYSQELNQGSPILRKIPVYGNGANINRGALVVRGVTANTNIGFAVLPANQSTNLANVIGVMDEAHTNSVAGNDTNNTGTNFTARKVIVNTGAIFEAEYDQTVTAAVVSTSGTTVTITSLESGIQGGWLFAVSGTGAGSLYLITTSASGSCTTKTATGWDSTTTVIKILPLYYANLYFNSTFDKLGTQAAAGVTGANVLENVFVADGQSLHTLNGTVDSGLTGLTNAKFFSRIRFNSYLAQ